jgi:hypothetical protein
MATAAILGLTVGLSLVTVRAVLSQREEARHNVLAVRILDAEMENIRLLGWPFVSGLESGTFEVDHELRAIPAERFHRRLVVQDLKDGARELSLEVEWLGRNGIRSIRSATLSFCSSDVREPQLPQIPGRGEASGAGAGAELPQSVRQLSHY